MMEKSGVSKKLSALFVVNSYRKGSFINCVICDADAAVFRSK